jgi:hypothetical protein
MREKLFAFFEDGIGNFIRFLLQSEIVIFIIFVPVSILYFGCDYA